MKTKKGAILIMVIVIMQLVVILSTFILIVAVNSTKRGATSIKRIEENIFIENTAQYFVNDNDIESYNYNKELYTIESDNDELIIKNNNKNNNIFYMKKESKQIIEYEVRQNAIGCELHGD